MDDMVYTCGLKHVGTAGSKQHAVEELAWLSGTHVHGGVGQSRVSRCPSGDGSRGSCSYSLRQRKVPLLLY